MAGQGTVNKLDPRNHGNAWSIYFSDPEGNRVELYCSSPWHVSQPFGEPLDLDRPAEAIRAKTEAMVKQDPTCQPMDVWVAQMSQKMSTSDTSSGSDGSGARADAPLVRHQHRQFGIRQDVARRAAEDHLPQPALGECALDQEIAAFGLRRAQDRLAGALPSSPTVFSFAAMPLS